MLSIALLAATTLALPGPSQEKRKVEFAVVANANNGTKALTTKQFARIFRAEKMFWDDQERIYLILPRSGSPERDYLLDEVYALDEAQLKRYWIELVFQNKIPAVPKVLPSSALTLAVVTKRTEAIGFVCADEIGTDSEARILAIDGKRPGQEGYPLVKIVTDDEEHTPPEEGTEDQDARDEASQREAASTLVARSVQASRPQDDENDRLARLEGELAALREQIEYEDELEHGLILGPKLNLRGFTDVVFGARDVDRDSPGLDETSNEFALGQVDLFITSQLSERLSALSEVVFTAKSDGSNGPNIERAIVKYNLSDGLNFQAGRFHTTLGHWNEAYHHGEWFHTTIGRPQIVNFNGGGGLLPIHLIGLVLKGRQGTDGMLLDYTLEAGNGRGPTRGFDQVASDVDDAKAINVAVGVQPTALDGLRLGGGVYVDEIPPNTKAAAGPLHGNIDETILNAFATYYAGPWEVLAEYFRFDHEGGSSDPDTDSNGFYVQVGYEVGDWTPYVRLEGIGVDDASTFFENQSDLDRYLIGARWDFSTWSALKFQVAYSEMDASPGGNDESEIELAVQWSYAF